MHECNEEQLLLDAVWTHICKYKQHFKTFVASNVMCGSIVCRHKVHQSLTVLREIS